MSVRDRFSPIVADARWAAADATDWLMRGRRRYIVMGGAWLLVAGVLVHLVGHQVSWAGRRAPSAAWWAIANPKRTALVVVCVAALWKGGDLWFGQLRDRGPIPTRVVAWLVWLAYRGATFVVVLAWDFRQGSATGMARVIWRTSRIKTDADTRVDRKTHGGRRLPGRVQRARTLVLPRRADGTRQPPIGLEVDLRLPAGWTVDDLDGTRIASATFRTINARVASRPDRGPEFVRVSLLRRDPLLEVVDAGAPEAGRIVVGVDEYGRAIVLDLDTSHAAIGGMPRSGKTNVLHQIVAPFAVDHLARVAILDGKNVDFPKWRSRVDHLVGARPAEALAVLRRVRSEMEKRYDAMELAGFSNWRDMPPKIAPGAFLVAVDETPIYIDDREHGSAIEDELVVLMRLGLAANVRVVLATQKATGDAMPTRLRDLAATRIAFSCSSVEMGQAILGPGRGQLAVSIPGGDAYRGRLVVVNEDGTVIWGRGYRVSPSWLDRYAQPSRRRKQPAGDAPAPAPRSGAGAPPRTLAGDETTTRASADDAPADTRPRTRPPGVTKAEWSAQNAAAHAEQRAAWLAETRRTATLDQDDDAASPPRLAVVGGVKRREER